MKKKSFPVIVWSERVLPLRNDKTWFTPTPLLTYHGQIWFTPEAVVFDAIRIFTDVLWLWRFLTRKLPILSMRVAALVGLIFLVVGVNDTRGFAQTDERPIVVERPVELKIDSSIAATPTTKFTWPVSLNYISTYFNYFHQGIDLPKPLGTPVKSYSNGVVTLARWDGGYGQSVVVEHPEGYVTRYAHLSAINVKPGDQVNTTTTVGLVGSTGFSTGPHLHFEIHRYGRAINPLNVLP